MSHTVEVRVEIRDKAALAAAVKALGGEVLGEGTYRLFSTRETGFAFRLPGWRYPLILKEDGTLAFDDYEGQWGDRKAIDRLRERYAIEVARMECERLGWYCEEQEGKLIVYHPDGGMLTVSPEGEIDAQHFEGRACEEATRPLAEVLGERVKEILKPEYWAEHARVRERE